MKAIDHHRDEERRQARREYLTEQVELLLAGEDAQDVKFFSYRPAGRFASYIEGFADKLMEQLGEIDRGIECWVVQCLLAVGRGDLEQAALIYDKYLRTGINEFAEKLVLEACE